MATFNYECPKCGAMYEMVRKHWFDGVVVCPAHGCYGNMQQVILDAPAGIVHGASPARQGRGRKTR